MAYNIKNLVLSLFSIGIGVLSLINQEFWPAGISLIVAGFLVFYFSEYFDQVNINEIEIRKLSEKLKIHEQLISMKGDIEYLKNEQKRIYR